MKLSDLTVYNNTVLLDNGIEVLQYLSIEDKNSIIQMALQNSLDNTIYNECKLKMFFELYVVYMYSNIEITDEEKEDPVLVYDKLTSNGIVQSVCAAISRTEFTELCEMLTTTKNNKMKYSNSVAATINRFISELPTNAEAAKSIIEQFNPEDFQNVLNFARAANGGREIN